jgi:molybdenum cofactor cytidylyltransferase
VSEKPAAVGGLILAAGAGTRFGAPKQLARFRGRPLLEHVLRAMADAGVRRRVVVLGAEAAGILRAVDLHGAEPVVCRDWAEGQSASLRAGLRALGPVDAAVVVLGDQPLVSAEAVERVIAARGGGAEAVRAEYGGRPGHPVLLERDAFERLATLRGDAGARELLRDLNVTGVRCDGLGRPDDVDTPEQLEVLQHEARAVV